jgi:hypothetical protein
MIIEREKLNTCNPPLGSPADAASGCKNAKPIPDVEHLGMTLLIAWSVLLVLGCILQFEHDAWKMCRMQPSLSNLLDKLGATNRLEKHFHRHLAAIWDETSEYQFSSLPDLRSKNRTHKLFRSSDPCRQFELSPTINDYLKANALEGTQGTAGHRREPTELQAVVGSYCGHRLGSQRVRHSPEGGHLTAALRGCLRGHRSPDGTLAEAVPPRDPTRLQAARGSSHGRRRRRGPWGRHRRGCLRGRRSPDGAPVDAAPPREPARS